eukprot:TRINITY_DN2556_c0_g1::TRINITY_DN2556_c0_g1_i1::g.19161::m.19161 TRINITY_DN2556_c0_g1::TRINITY_DN2556_c0_g1_i1::g.19161  ORF type:complete len:969 (-),score=310.54,sp/Q9XHM1/EIF3C_MEDTR/40.77/0.0,eIF-3c_N/PF05470.7/6.9e-186,PCI/PF01399.22/5.7e+03,PCI/PF01399.22/1.5e-14,Baculo_DNA_bind/PF04786.7/0.015,Baculo_DNA_bind/PF04786.7/3e+03,DUF4363/PF14276.1/7.9,DUF4363/PF14276.1/21,TPR_2/PF07719.12/1.5e+04,TPR_2/PF07719.12/2.1,TPR_2/PF07719.12/1.5e+03,PTS_IIA/PF02255.11/5.8e+03,PTS_IIA/PF02255.11/1.5,PTS
MSNRFWAGESESESDETASASDSEVSSVDQKPQVAKPGKAKDYDFSESDEEVKRVVKSAKDKRFEALQEIVNKIKNHIKINDWNAINTDFEDLNRQLAKSRTVMTQNETVPRLYIKGIALIEDSANTTFQDKASIKKMSSTNAKSFNAVRQKVRKNNKVYESQIEEYRKNPDLEDDKPADKSDKSDSESDDESKSSSSSSSSSDSDSDESDSEKSGSSDDSSDEDSDDDWSSDSSSSDDEIVGDRRSRWLKKPGYKSSSDEESDDEKAKKKLRRLKEKKKLREEKEKEKDKKPDEKKEEEKLGFEVNEEGVAKRLAEVVGLRGKKGTDAQMQVREIRKLLPYAQTPAQRIAILVALASASFDINLNTHSHMTETMWRQCCAYLIEILAMLNKHNDIILGGEESVVPLVDKEDFMAKPEEGKEETENEYKETAVQGNLLAFIERLDDELFKCFQNVDNHSEEYIHLLQDEQIFLEMAYAVQCYYHYRGDSLYVTRIASRRLEHMYYKHDSLVQLARQREAQKGPFPARDGIDMPCSIETIRNARGKTLEEPDEPRVLIHNLATLIYKHGDERSKSRAMLCHIYHHALHDRWAEARDMMLMSHSQDTIMNADIMTQILYNRTMVQLGLCAFRLGYIEKAHDALTELCSNGRVKELLAQGVTARYHEKNPEQEKLERRRQTPFHLHINYELIESVHLISAMLLEVPNMAANAFDVKRRVISKVFRRQMDYYNNQVFQGPPEVLRDHVMCAARHLMKGDWQQAQDIINKLKMWQFIPNSAEVKAMLNRRIQLEALRTYIFTFASSYDSLSLAILSRMFNLDEKVVHANLSKMMINDELHASWDQPTSTIVMHKHAEPTRLQFLALQLADKVNTLVENNERLLDCRTALGKDEKRTMDRSGQGQYRERDNQNRGDGVRRPFRDQGSRAPGAASSTALQWNRRVTTSGYIARNKTKRKM